MGLFALDKTDKEIIVEDNNKFAFDLYSQVRKDDGNLFFSPFSISTALAMTYAGAKGNTETQMAETLRFSLSQERLHPAFLTLMQELQADSEKKGFELSIANALWGQEGYKFHEAFIDITESYYEAGFKEADFIKNIEQTRQSINTWVEEKTKDKIKELIKPGILNDLTRLVLTNAIYFKGKWMSQFIKERNSQQEFKLLSGKKVEIPMMNQTKEFGYFENDGLQVLEMPYEGDKLAMVILLPKETNSINNLENSLSPENVKGWLSRLQKQEVIVFMPKFKMTSEFELNKTLEILGMTDAFSKKADFSGMTPDPVGLYISKVIHKAFVDVNEEGTEAAAATAVVMTFGGMPKPKPKPVFRADRPFVFVIRDMKSGSILFMGRVMDPR
jgi:serpin B